MVRVNLRDLRVIASVGFFACVLNVVNAIGNNGLEEKLEFTIDEGVPQGTLVGRIEKRDGYAYRLNERNRFFTFNSSTGEIRTTADLGAPLLDREVLERYGYKHDEVDFVILGVASQSSLNPATYFVAVTVRVNDINDNAPTFPFSFQNVTLPESARVGTRLILASATDADEGENGSVKEYRVMSGNEDNVFQLGRGGNGGDESSEAVFLELLKSLDRETKNLHILNVTAVDGGKPALAGFLTVFVNILDSNDNQPIFERRQYSVSVSENLPASSSILLVSATDKDSGDNARITYSIENDMDNQFRINPDSGLVSSNIAPLKCPEMKAANASVATRVCTFTVEAVDHGVPAQRGRTFVNVELFDVNDHAPEIFFRYYSPSENGNSAEAAAIVDETKPVGTVIAVVTVTDPDHGDNGRTSVSIVKGNELGHFRLESNELFSVVRTNSTLKRTIIDQYNLTIMASDRGTTPKFTFKNMLIYVNDVNDQPPAFDQPTYSAKIPENSPLNTFVTSVKAKVENMRKVADGCKAGVWYGFVNGTFSTTNNTNSFRLDHKTGLISVIGPLDFDEVSADGRNFTLAVSGRDACRPSLRSSTAMVMIEVVDVNDQPPRFSKTVYDVSVYENASVGSVILELEAYDGDSGENAIISYSFVNTLNESKYESFEINPTTGMIALSSPLDRERTDSYKLAVVASDHGSPQLKDFTTVNIRVLDVNDNIPKFVTAEYYANLHPFDPAGTVLTRIYAEDPDEGVNGEVAYFFLEQPQINAIALSQKTGEVYLKRRIITTGALKRFDVHLGATDGGGRRASNNATIHVFLSDTGSEGNVSNDLPKFSKDAYVFRVQEDSGISSTGGEMKSIGTVSATDADTRIAAASPIQYKIVDGDDTNLFGIGQYSGELRATRKVDYEEGSEYKLTVVALGRTGIAAVDVKIEIEDINDNAPKFATNATKLLVERRFPAGYVIHTIKAIDLDSGKNGLVKYRLKDDGDATKYFAVDENFGTVYLKVSAHLMRKSDYTIWCLASDGGSPVLNDTTTLRIVVVDGDPRFQSWFSQRSYDFAVWENTLVNARLIKLNMTRPCNQNGTTDCTFYVEDELADDVFGVFPDGWLFVKNELDYENRSSFRMNIAVKQMLGLTYGRSVKETKSVAVVNIQLVDQNDNSPRCAREKFSFSLPEHADNLTYVGTVTANDADSGLNGFVTYRLVPDSDNSSAYFHIGASTGVLRALRAFDREDLLKVRGSAVASFVVEAADLGKPEPKRIRCNVEVAITDINDHAPRFALDVYAVSIPENQDFSKSEILRVSATDEDESQNAVVEFLILEGDDEEPRFWLNSTTGQLFLRRSLDRERKDAYILTLMVRDFGAPARLNSTAHVTIFVLDVNDNTPAFVNFQNVISLSESTPIGSLISRIRATDADSGAAGNVRYFITKGNVGQTFELDPVTGALTLVKPLDYESQRNFTLTVFASDQGTPSLTNISEIVVVVEDENDNAPVITSSVMVFHVPEDSPVGSNIFTVTATDPDGSVNGTVRFAIVDQKPSASFKIDEDSGIVSVASSLETEFTDVYNVVIEATDSCENASLRLSTRRMITLLLTDDAAAASGNELREAVIQCLKRGTFQFEKPRFEFRMAKASGNGTEIGQVKLQENSPSTNKNKEYYVTKSTVSSSNITNIAGNELVIDVGRYTGILFSTGLLRQKRLRSKMTDMVMLEITAVEIASESTACAKCEVIVKIDQGVRKPKFTENFYQFQVREDADIGTTIGNVKTLDDQANGDPDARSFIFSIVNNTLAPFYVDAGTGKITTAQVIDRELVAFYDFEVRVVDGSFSAYASVHVDVLDVNDNDPEFGESDRTSPAFHFKVVEGGQKNSLVGRVAAVDRDSGANGEIEYSLVQPELGAYFSLDAITGFIRINQFIDREENAFFFVDVQASDRGNPPRRAKTTVFIEVSDVNDNPPVLERSFYDVSVYENATIGTSLLQLRPWDYDIDTEFYFSIVSGNVWSDFTIDSNGTLTVASTLNRETHSVYHLVVSVYDQLPHVALRQSTNAQVTITVLDVNDCAPQFTSANWAVVKANAQLGATVTTVKAIDSDEGRAGVVSYLLDPKSAGVFNLDSVSGELRLIRVLPTTPAIYNLSIWAYDGGEPRLSTESYLLVYSTLDAGYGQPTFAQKSIEIVVDEDVLVGKTLARLNLANGANEEDRKAAVRFWMLERNGQEADFVVSPDSGIVSVARPIDFERISTYNLTVAVANLKMDEPTDQATILVLVRDVNDNSPVFLQSPVYFDVVEGSWIAQAVSVGLVTAVDADSGSNGKLSYAIIQGNTSVFSIDSLTGELRMQGEVDREAIESYILSVEVADSGTPRRTATTRVIVSVLDVNDNEPVFDKPSYVGKVVENQAVGTSVLQVSATDADEGENGVVSYKLESPDKLPFAIDSTSGLISIKASLDREFVSTYNFYVVATDSAIGRARGSRARVLVKVEDENDNTPVFIDTSQDIYISSSAANGGFVYVIGAEDADEGDNARLTYSLGGRDAKYFDIAAETGVIHWKNSASAKSASDFSVDAFVSDMGRKEVRNASTSLRFFPRSADDFPKFTHANARNYTIRENETNAAIMVVTARSSKRPPLNRITYSIAAGNFGGAFALNPLTGQLTTTVKLDYEFRQSYELHLAATDNDTPPLTSFAKIVIFVEDCNDNAPNFQETSYAATVLEEEPAPITVVRVKASDADSGLNGRIKYSLRENEPLEIKNLFEIDSETGAIATKSALDREKAGRYQIVVDAIDGGTPPLTSSVPVIVTVTDVNDNAPKFTRLFTGSVLENAAVGTFVTQVTSSDADSAPENANNTYYFSANPGEKFSIDSKTGDVTVQRPLDQESEAEYQLKVVAVDGAWRVETSLIVTILDVNDNAPVFSKSNYTFTVSASQPPLTLIGSVQASDNDEKGPNSKVMYTLLEKSSLFLIDSQDGGLRTARTLHWNPMGSNLHTLSVVAEDAGRPILSSVVQVTVNIVGNANLLGDFGKKSLVAAIPLEIAKGSKIVRAADESANDEELDVLYSLEERNDDFAVDPKSGWIVALKHLSNAVGAQRKMTVIAKDPAAASILGTIDLTLVVTGANKYAPEFSSSTYSVTVAENVAPGSAIFTVSARDYDQGLNGKVTYDCVKNQTKDDTCRLFAVDEDTGVIVLRKELDYEIAKIHKVVVSATDGGFEVKPAFATLTVSVQDVNDNPPRFESTGGHPARFVANVQENAIVGARVFRLNCTDADSPPYDVILYSIENGADNRFVVDENSGLISVAGEIDYETKSAYELLVKCRNSDSASLVSTATLTILIDGVNEYLPKFDKPSYEFEADWATPNGAIVGVVKATDYDAGRDGLVYYSTKAGEGSGLLTINELTGEVMVRRRDGANSSSVTILAQNCQLTSPSEIAIARVTIRFSRTKSNAPTFASKTMYVDVLENATVGTIVMKINATAARLSYYELSGGNVDEAFRIEAETGLLRTNGKLNRETLDTYSLMIKAYAERNSSLYSTATAIVTVLDVNDNPPYLTESASTGYILENEPSGSSIMTLLPSDSDLPPNDGPFEFTLLQSKWSHLFHLDSRSGVLKSKAVFDRESANRYVFPVKIADGGRPSLWAVSNVTVVVVDVNDSPSSAQPIRVVVSTSHAVVAEKMDLAVVSPTDPDSLGDYSCKLRKDNETTTRVVLKPDCLVTTRVPVSIPSEHKLLLTGSDGSHDWVDYEATVQFEKIEEDLIQNAVFMTVLGDRGKLAKTFPIWLDSILSKLAHTKVGKVMVKLLYVGPKKMVFTEEMEIALAITRENGKALLLPEAASLLDSLMKTGYFKDSELEVKSIFKGFCAGVGMNLSKPCENGGKCVEIATVDNGTYQFVTEGSLILSYPKLTRFYRCDCPVDFSGVNCETIVDQCAANPCANGATCSYRKEQSKLECICPSGFTGERCEEDIDECKTTHNGQPACFNNGWCENTKGSYRCVCMVGYSGWRCENSANYCAAEPCLNGGKCVATANGYECACEFGYTGSQCQFGSKGFEEASYIEVKSASAITNGSENIVQFEFATIRENTLLVYSSESEVDGDYLALDVRDGRLRVSGIWGNNKRALSSVIGSKTVVSNGRWYRVVMQQQNNTRVTVSIGECSSKECAMCRTNDETCRAVLNGGRTRQTIFPGKSVFFGTAGDFGQILSRAPQIAAPGFVGCMRNVKIGGVGIDQLDIGQENVLDYCPRASQAPCSSNQSSSCGDGENCRDGWSKPICSCRGGYSSSNCRTGNDAVNLAGNGYIGYQLVESYRRRLLFAHAAPDSKTFSPDDTYRVKRLASSRYPKQWIILEFRTTSSDGLLFFAMSSSEEFSMIDIANGTVRYLSRTQESKPMQISLNDGPFVSDGEWHLVSLALQPSGNEVEFRIDNFGKDARSNVPLHWLVSSNLTAMSVGGAAEPVTIGGNTVKGFNGCLRKFIVNGVLQPLLHGDKTFFNADAIGHVNDGCDANSACVSPPCENVSFNGDKNGAHFNGGVVAVIVFFACMIISTIAAYFVVKRMKSRKCDKKPNSGSSDRTAFIGGASTVPNISTLSDIVRLRQQSECVNLNGSIKDSGIVLGISRQTLDSSQISLNNPLDAHGTATSSALSASTYLNNYLNSDRDGNPDDARAEAGAKSTGAGEARNGTRPNLFVERYDLDDASSIAPSDADVAKHYRDFRQNTSGVFAPEAPPRKLPSKFLPPSSMVDSAIPSLFGSRYTSAENWASRNRKNSAFRVTPTSVLMMMPESESSDDVMMQRNVRALQDSRATPESVAKMRPETAGRSLRSRQRRAAERGSGKLRRSNRSSTKSKNRRRHGEQQNRDSDISSVSGASSSDSTATLRNSLPISRRSTPLANSSTPRILSRPGKNQDFSSQKSSTNDDYSDCVSAAMHSDFDLDQVRKPRRFLQPPEDTETDSDANAVNSYSKLPFCLDQFIPGPRTLFLMSEDDNTSDGETALKARTKSGKSDSATRSSPRDQAERPEQSTSQRDKEGLEAYV